MCIAFSIIERVYWYLRVILSSMFVVESSYVSFLRSSFSLYSLCRVFCKWDEWPLRYSGSLSLPSLHSLLMWLHFMLDSSGSSLLFVFFASPSSSSHPLSFSYSDPYSQFDTSCVSSLHISLSDHFSSLPRYWYYIHIRHIQVHGSRAFLYMLYFIHEGIGFWSLGIWA